MIMPKKNGVVKTFSFGTETMNQIDKLCEEYMLKRTALIEFLINKEFKNYFFGDKIGERMADAPYTIPISLKENVKL